MDSMRYFFILVIICVLQLPNSAQKKYTANWESLAEHPTPAWFGQAKFGIFIHWGIYSVPAYCNFYQGKEETYAEWYAPDLMYKPWRNNNFHAKNYGENFSYRDFASDFKAELWEPQQWARLFAASGAKYVVFTAKHHDGYCMWDTNDPVNGGWNSMKTGPKRDVVAELSEAVRQNGLRFGVYYSLLEWESTRTNWPHDSRYAGERTGYYIPKKLWDSYHLEDSVFIQHLHFQLQELVKKYRPDLVFADGAWDYPDSYWKSTEFLAWLYNNASNKRDILVNDRWGNNSGGEFGDYFSSEYSDMSRNTTRAWEECQGMGYSYGYNRAENIEDVKTAKELIETLCRTVSSGGNFLLNIGPTADGRIPLIQQERLYEVGKWLEVNGKAIFKTLPEIIDDSEHTFTRNGKNIYAFQYQWTKGSIKINLPADIIIKNCILLGHDSKLVWKQQGNELLIFPPVIDPDNENVRYVYVFHLMLDQI